MFTINDVAPSSVNGQIVELTDEQKQAIVDEWNANLAKVQVPKKVTMRQARLALLQAGKLQAVNESIASMPGADGDAARIEWEFSSEVHRDKALVQALAPTLGMTDAQLDDLFTIAATL